MLPKNGHSVEKKYFLYSIIKIYDVNYYLKHRKNIFCNLTIFELVNEIEDFESLCISCTLGYPAFTKTYVRNRIRSGLSEERSYLRFPQHTSFKSFKRTKRSCPNAGNVKNKICSWLLFSARGQSL